MTQNTKYTMWVFGKSFILLLWNRTSLNLVLNARNDVFSVFSEEHLESSACHVSFQDDFPDFPYPLLFWHLLQCPALASWLSLKHKKTYLLLELWRIHMRESPWATASGLRSCPCCSELAIGIYRTIYGPGHVVRKRKRRKMKMIRRNQRRRREKRKQTKKNTQ